jgi:hypothetical protein
MKKIILLAFLSIMALTTNAQGCDPYYSNEPCFRDSIIVSGYSVYFYNCGSYIKIDTIKYTGSGAPNLNFTNVVIPSMLDIKDGVDIYFPGSCVHWQRTNCMPFYAPDPSNPRGPGIYEGLKCDFVLVNCSKDGCCKWTKIGDGILEDDFGLLNNSQCNEIVTIVDQTTGQRYNYECFPLCSEMRKVAWAPMKGYAPITVSPNPASTQIQFSQIDNIASIIIYDAVGRIVYSKEATSKIIDVSKFQKGTYFIQLNRIDGKIEAKNFQIH